MNTDPKKVFAYDLIRWRWRRNYNHAQAAKELNTDAGTIMRWENEPVAPSEIEAAEAIHQLILTQVRKTNYAPSAYKPGTGRRGRPPASFNRDKS